MNYKKAVLWLVVTTFLASLAFAWATIYLNDLVVFNYRGEANPSWYYACLMAVFAEGILFGVPAIILLGFIGVNNLKEWRASRGTEATGGEAVVRGATT